MAEPARRTNTIPSESGSDRGKCPVVRWRDVGQEGVLAFMAPLLAENRPFLMSGYWTHQVLCKDAAQRWKTFAGIKSVLAGHGLDQLRVDVSCTKKGHSFRGDQANRQHVSLRLIDMVELAEANETGQPHWAAAEEVGLDYYLCQCPVVSREVGKPEVLSAIAGEFRTPSCVLEEDLLQINLWLGAMETTTNMHYDANHNLLFVLKGSKRVALLPPDMTSGVHAMPVFSESANHCGLRHEDAVAVAGSAEGMRKGAVYADVAEGEALFIPEGWWHQITSSRGTVATNVWFKGVRPALCEGPSRHMREYYLRCLVGSLLADRLREAVADEGRGFDAEGRVVGTKRPRPPPAAVEVSPLTAPASTADERNAYLRTIGTDRMKEELPRIAMERPPDWARLVTGLDPLTAHVVTTQWETAGGAAKMPGFYEAIFGSIDESGGAGVGDGAAGDTIAGTGVVDGGAGGAIGGTGVVDGAAGGAIAGGGGDVRIDDGVGGGVQAGAAEAVMNAAFGDSGIEDAAAQLQQPPPHQLPQLVVDAGAAAAAAAAAEAAAAAVATERSFRRNEEFCGVALQERLVRLREMFAQEQCGKILSGAVGW